MNIFNIFKKSLDRYTLFEGMEAYEERYKSKYDFLKLNEISLYLNKAIEKRADKVGEIDFIIKRGDDIIEHPLLDVLNKPNEYHTGFQFWSLTQKYIDLAGEAFIFIMRERELFENSKIKGLYLLRPDLVRVDYKPDGTLKGYNYKMLNGKEINYLPEQVLHIFNPDPLNPLRGASLIKSGIRTIDTDLQLSEYHSRVIANGGKVEGVFKINDPTMTREKLTQLKQSYKEQYAGAKKAGEPLFLGGDMEYLNIGLNPSELSYLETKKISMNDICMLTGVPKEILASVGETTYANAGTAYEIFLRETIKPIMDRLTTIIDWRLLDKDHDLQFIDPTPENVEKKLEAIKTADSVNALTLNEKRQLLSETIDGFDLEPITDKEADQIYQPMNLMPITREDNPQKSEVKKKMNHPLRDYENRRRHELIKKKQMEQEEKKLLKVIKKVFHEQRDELIEALGGKKNLLGEVFNYDKEVNRLKLALPPILTEIMVKAGNEAMASVGADPTFTATATIQSWISKRTEETSDWITETSFKELEGAFIESFSLGESRRELISRIEDVYKDFDKVRATRIARTETHSAFQKGTFDGYGQAGMEIKIWVTSLQNSRDSHIANDGLELPMNVPFPNGQMFPGDTNAPIEEYINCQCTI